MKYHVETVIDVPRHQVIELFDDPENLKAWNQDLETFEHLDGEPGAVGARSRLVFGKIEMIETIVSRDLPERFAATYETDSVHNLVENRFVDLDGERTRWEMDNEFRFDAFWMKAMAKLAPWAFQSESLKRMERFKQFAESRHPAPDSGT